MIADEPIIQFSPDDAPDLPELRKPEKPKREPIPEPEEWRPIGAEW